MHHFRFRQEFPQLRGDLGSAQEITDSGQVLLQGGTIGTRAPRTLRVTKGATARAPRRALQMT
eukprot:460371-Pyramimonas_sp.AAC.1